MGIIHDDDDLINPLWPNGKFGERTDSSAIGLPGYDAWLSNVGEWPSVDEGEDEAPPLGQRAEFRIVCEVCREDYGGTVGAKNPEIRWITCAKCKAKGESLTKTTGAD